MIYDELKNYLVKIASAETVDSFDESITLLELYEVPNYLEVFETVIGEQSARSDADILDVLQVNLKLMLNNLLTMQGVTLSDDVTPSQTNTVVGALHTLLYYEDKGVLLDIMSGEGDAQETLCELLSLVCPYTVDEAMAMVQEVSPSFVPNFKDMLEGTQETAMRSADEVKQQIKTFISFKRYLRNAPTFADRFFQQLGSIGLPLLTYVHLYQNEQLDFSTMTPSAIALDLLGLACLSEDAHKTPAIALRGVLSTLFADINTATKVDIETFAQTIKWEAFNAQA